MAETNGVTVDFLVWLEFKAVAQLQPGLGIGAVAFARERKLGALGVDELAVARSVVMLFVFARREQAADVTITVLR